MSEPARPACNHGDAWVAFLIVGFLGGLITAAIFSYIVADTPRTVRLSNHTDRSLVVEPVNSDQPILMEAWGHADFEIDGYQIIQIQELPKK